MQSEDRVPVVERCLLLEGLVSDTSLAAVRPGLPDRWPEPARCCFATYAYADLPLGKTYEIAFPEGAPLGAEPTRAIIRAVTQQFARPFDEVPDGWKTVLVIEFPDGVPAVVDRLPIVDGWGQGCERVALCSRETLEAVRVGGGDVRPRRVPSPT